MLTAQVPRGRYPKLRVGDRDGALGPSAFIFRPLTLHSQPADTPTPTAWPQESPSRPCSRASSAGISHICEWNKLSSVAGEAILVRTARTTLSSLPSQRARPGDDLLAESSSLKMPRFSALVLCCPTFCTTYSAVPLYYATPPKRPFLISFPPIEAQKH